MAAPAIMLPAKTFPVQQSVGDTSTIIVRQKTVPSLLPGESQQSS